MEESDFFKINDDDDDEEWTEASDVVLGLAGSLEFLKTDCQVRGLELQVLDLDLGLETQVFDRDAQVVVNITGLEYHNLQMFLLNTSCSVYFLRYRA